MKRILFADKYLPGRYIRKDDPAGFRRLNHNLEIISALEKIGELNVYQSLSVKKTRYNCLVSGPYDFIITNIPYIGMMMEAEPSKQKYDDDIYIVKTLHDEFPTTVIIAYTEGGPEVFSDKRLRESGVSHVFWRHEDDSEEDMKNNLEQILKVVKNENS